MTSAVCRTTPASVARCFAFGFSILAAGCNTQGDGNPTPQVAPDHVPAVKTVQPERKSIQRLIEQPAFVEAFEETPLFARISGYVRKVNVDIGDRVKGPGYDGKGKAVEGGQVLAELSVPEMVEELRQKTALVAQARAEVDQSSAALDAAEAHIATAKAQIQEAEAGRERTLANFERWESEYRRIEALAKSKVLDEQILDETRNQFKSAGASRKEVEAKVGSAQAAARESEAKRDKARADVAAAKAKVQVAQAEEGRLSAMLDYTKVRAPYDGVITTRNIHTGHFLTGAGVKPLFVIARMDIVRILVDVPEADAMFVADGVPARIRFQMIKEQEFEAKVTRSSWSLDAQARTLRTQIDLPNPQGRLRPGMYAYVNFQTQSPSGFTLPASAVITQGDQVLCFQVENGKAVRTPIKVGARNNQIVQVLKKQTKSAAKAGEPGLWADFTGQEQVVVSNAGSLTDGQAVQRRD
jgi:HlyD family secretion protein